MQEQERLELVIPALEEVVVGLERASGLSLSLCKAAHGLEALSRESHLLERVKSFLPNSAAQARELREVGAKLYNACARGPSNDIALLKLRVLACEAMRRLCTGHFAQNDMEEDGGARRLEAMRCFSKTGLLLMGVSQSELALDAFETCLQLAGSNALDLIQLVHGNTQTAHDCGNAYFSALCGLIELYFESLLSSPNPSAASHRRRSDVLARVLELLQENCAFIARVRARNQTVLRAILEAGMERLTLEESLPFQTWLFKEWERFASSSPGLQQAIAARLAFALAQTGDAVGSVAALERANTVPNLSIQESKDNEEFLLLARCATASASLRSETKLAKLAGAPTTSTTASLEQHCVQCFAELVANLCMERTSLEMRDLVLNCAADVAVLAQRFDDTFGKLVDMCLPNMDLACSVLQRALKAEGGRAWMINSPRALAALQSIALTTPTVTRNARCILARALWNELCALQRERDWPSVANCSALVAALTTSEAEMQSKCIQASVLASLAIHLPDRDGDEARELDLLQTAQREAIRARELAQTDRSRQSAAALELKCLVRISALTADQQHASECYTCCGQHLRAAILPPEAILQLASEAEGVNAQECAQTLLLLARDFIVSQAAAPTNSDVLERLTKKLVQLRGGNLLGIGQDFAVYAEYVSSLQSGGGGGSEHVEQFVHWGKQVLLALSREVMEREQQRNGMECALDIAALLNALVKLLALLRRDQKESEDDYVCALAGELVAACATALAEDQSLALKQAGRELIARCGEEANSALSKLSLARKNNDVRVTSIALLSTLFMASAVAATASCDELVAKRVRAICEMGEFAFPTKLALEQAGALARILHLYRTARDLLLRLISMELREMDPDYQVVAHCFCKLLCDCQEKEMEEESMAGWMDQLDAIRNNSKAQLPSHVLERSALACWRKPSVRKSVYLSALCRDWLQSACEANKQVAELRHEELKEMESALHNISSSSSQAAPAAEEEDDRETVDEEGC